jgi:hypothetical protein
VQARKSSFLAKLALANNAAIFGRLRSERQVRKQLPGDSPEKIARYAAMLGKPGTAIEKFSRIVCFHMDEGTRPLTDSKQGIAWVPKEFAGELSDITLTTISNWRNGTKIPSYTTNIERVFLGTAVDGDTAVRKRWRVDLRGWHDKAKKERSKRAKGKKQVKKDPLLYALSLLMDDVTRPKPTVADLFEVKSVSSSLRQPPNASLPGHRPT